MKTSIRYVWLKMPEGKFSNSWSEKEHKRYEDILFSKEELQKATE